MPARPAVLIVANDALARAGLAALLADEPAVTLAGRISAGEDLPAALAAYAPDVVLWDLGWQPERAIEPLLAVADAAPPIAVLLPDGDSAAAAWLAGARGLLPRDASPQVIAAALLALAEGLTVVAPEFAQTFGVLTSPHILPAPSQEVAPPVEPLTARELEVLRLLAEGLPNKTIAQRLRISEHTVKFHVNAILGKLGAASRTEAVVRATRLGLLLL